MGTHQMRIGGDSYLASFPKRLRWINQCTACGRKGTKPEMPKHIGHSNPNFGAYLLRKYFEPLALNRDGLCEQCEAARNPQAPSISPHS